ncbi:uroporphyrinogen decarboxylase [Gimesia maris]|uniref:uroporphyrinogen decarboxylase n=1 Tax=Gimesia maris TaxID=122 RepID=UPI00241FE415|nr:uroporphyrinogen decarboxylase [Gimesia maris]|tara:strand:+ start:235072 stop:236130 length:1059 start_codon:yes stop_codon:yes gene_type:complete
MDAPMAETARYQNSRFMKAVRREPVDTTPIWIMRQAGRYLPEYMEVRNKVTFIELCKTPALAAEVTLTAQRVLGVDAAILFADLLPILEPMGLDLEYLKGEGPVIHNPIQDASQVDRLTDIADMDCLDFVFQAVKLIRADLPADIPLLGFAGCPFTLASYAIEGGSSKNYRRTKQMMYNDPSAWNALMNRFVDNLIVYLQRQIAAGCQAVQIFDSWAGCLSPEDYQQYVQPYTAKLVAGVQDHAPVINFLTGNPALLGLQRQAGGQVFGVDWRINLSDAWEIFGSDVAIQGNMDPIALYAELPVLKQKAKAVLDAAAGRNGHIFNLGHGVMPDMNPDHVKALVEMVHELGTR